MSILKTTIKPISELSFDWVLKPHPRRKRLSIVVTREHTVEVRVPVNCPQSIAESFLHENCAWIERQLGRLPKPIEGLRWFGRVMTPPELEQLVASYELDCADQLREKKLTEYITRAIDKYWPSMEHWRKDAPRWRLRKMRSRWGSCSADGSIRFALKLSEVDPQLIEYVVLHELCHLKEMNHSPRFWYEVMSRMPDWQQRRARLRQP